MTPGVADLVCALHQFQADWPQCDTVAVTFRMPGGPMLTIRVAGPNLVSLEDDRGHLVTIPQ